MSNVICPKCKSDKVEVEEHPSSEIDAYNYCCHSCGHSGTSEDEETGKCDRCGGILPIGRGENFFWDEHNSEWICIKCQEKISDEIKSVQLRKAMIDFRNSAYELLKAFQDANDLHQDYAVAYPFDDSYDDVVSSIDDWVCIYTGLREKSREGEANE